MKDLLPTSQAVHYVLSTAVVWWPTKHWLAGVSAVFGRALGQRTRCHLQVAVLVIAWRCAREAIFITLAPRHAHSQMIAYTGRDIRSRSVGKLARGAPPHATVPPQS